MGVTLYAMLRAFPILGSVTLLVCCSAKSTPIRDLAALHDAPLYTFNEHEVDVYLRWLAKQPMDPVRRVVLLARKNVGQPRRIFLLGEYPFELYDPDPMYCLSASDCVTFVEQTYAMALSHDWPSFFQMLQRIRYKNGEVGILTRNHFMEADWNVNNAWLFDDVTEMLAGRAAVPMQVRIDRAAFLVKYGIEQDVAVETHVDVYVPRKRLPDVLDQLKDGDVIEIVSGDKQCQYVRHLGLIMHNAEGIVTILHSTRPAVREQPLLDYMERHPDVIGLKFLRMKAVAAVSGTS